MARSFIFATAFFNIIFWMCRLVDHLDAMLNRIWITGNTMSHFLRTELLKKFSKHNSVAFAMRCNSISLFVQTTLYFSYPFLLYAWWYFSGSLRFQHKWPICSMDMVLTWLISISCLVKCYSFLSSIAQGLRIYCILSF